jgi:hypothetical protein
VEIQQQVATLPPGKGYGYALSYEDDGLLATWEGVILQLLARSQKRITTQGLISTECVERVQALLPRFSGYFASIPPKAFLDDTTTKNVLIKEGQLSGIVDVDCVCFGDPLFSIALTQMSLLSRGMDTEYTDAWAEVLALEGYQHTILSFYTCLVCVDFLSEVGLIANQNNTLSNENQRITQLKTIFEQLIRPLELP